MILTYAVIYLLLAIYFTLYTCEYIRNNIQCYINKVLIILINNF